MDSEELFFKLDEELDVYCILNDIDKETEQELKFIISSFSKYITKMKDEKIISVIEVIKSFDILLESISGGVFGTGFKTKSIIIYKELPTINKIIKNGNDSFSRNQLFKELKESEKKIEDLEDKIKKLKSSSSSSSSSSYGGCSGGYSSSYGRC